MRRNMLHKRRRGGKDAVHIATPSRSIPVAYSHNCTKAREETTHNIISNYLHLG